MRHAYPTWGAAHRGWARAGAPELAQLGGALAVGAPPRGRASNRRPLLLLRAARRRGASAHEERVDTRGLGGEHIRDEPAADAAAIYVGETSLSLDGFLVTYSIYLLHYYSYSITQVLQSSSYNNSSDLGIQ